MEDMRYMKVYVEACGGKSAAAVIRKGASGWEGSAVTVVCGRRRRQEIHNAWISREWLSEYERIGTGLWQDLHGEEEGKGLLFEETGEDGKRGAVSCTGAFPEGFEALAVLLNRLFPKVFFLRAVRDCTNPADPVT